MLVERLVTSYHVKFLKFHKQMKPFVSGFEEYAETQFNSSLGGRKEIKWKSEEFMTY